MSETDLGKKLEPATKPRTLPLLTEEEKREREADLERITDRLVATLNAACSKKKKKRQLRFVQLLCEICKSNVVIVFLLSKDE